MGVIRVMGSAVVSLLIVVSASQHVLVQAADTPTSESSTLGSISVAPAEAEAAGCRVGVLLETDRRVVLEAVPADGWKFNRWDGPVLLSPQYRFNYITQPLNGTVSARFLPVIGCSSCVPADQPVSLQRLDVGDYMPALDSCRGYWAAKGSDVVVDPLTGEWHRSYTEPPIENSDGIYAVQYDYPDDGDYALRLGLRWYGQDYLPTRWDGIQFVARARPQAEFQIALVVFDSSLLETPLEGDKQFVMTGNVTLGQEYEVFRVPFTAFSLHPFIQAYYQGVDPTFLLNDLNAVYFYPVSKGDTHVEIGDFSLYTSGEASNCWCCDPTPSSVRHEVAWLSSEIPSPTTGALAVAVSYQEDGTKIREEIQPNSGTVSLRFSEEGEEFRIYFDGPVDADSAKYDGVSFLARAENPVEMTVFLSTQVETDESLWKDHASSCSLRLDETYSLYQVPFSAFSELAYYFKRDFPEVSSAQNLAEVTALKIWLKSLGPNRIDIRDLAFYSNSASASSAKQEGSLASSIYELSGEVQAPPQIEWQAPVDIYMKNPYWPIHEPNPNWPYDDPAVLFLQPTACDGIPPGIAHDYQARSLASISFGTFYPFADVSDLPDKVSEAFVVDINGSPTTDGMYVVIDVLDPTAQEYIFELGKSWIDDGADGFWMDIPNGTSHVFGWGGPFSDDSDRMFAEHLGERFSASELQELGVGDLDDFSYRDFVLTGGYEDAWSQDPFSVPLAYEYYKALRSAQTQVVAKLILDLHGYAESLGRDLSIAANWFPLSSFTDVDHYRPELDLHFFEHFYYSKALDGWPSPTDYPCGLPAWPSYKHAVGLGKEAVVLTSVAYFSYLMSLPVDQATSMVLHWLAEAYAHQGYLDHYDNPFDYGTEGRPGDYIPAGSVDREMLIPYYTFIREHPEFFSDLVTYADVAVVYPSTSTIDDQESLTSIEGLSIYLGERNVPHDIVPVSAASGYSTILANGAAWSESELNALLDFAKSGGTVVAFDSVFATLDEGFAPVDRPDVAELKEHGSHTVGSGTFVFASEALGDAYRRNHNESTRGLLDTLLDGLIAANGAPSDVVLVPYTSKSGVVVHVLNYDGADGRFDARDGVEVAFSLPRGFQARGRALSLCSPDFGGPIQIEYTVVDGVLHCTIPQLCIWAVLVLE